MNKNGYYQLDTSNFEDHAGETITDIDKNADDYQKTKEAFELLLKVREGKCDKPIIVTATDEHSIPFYGVPVICAVVENKNYWGIACFRYNNTANLEGRAWYIAPDNTLMMLEL